MQKNNNNNPKHVPTGGTAISWACFVISFIRSKLLALKPRQSFISQMVSSLFFRSLHLNVPVVVLRACGVHVGKGTPRVAR